MPFSYVILAHLDTLECDIKVKPTMCCPLAWNKIVNESMSFIKANNLRDNLCAKPNSGQYADKRIGIKH